ncbi:hypothetical protein Poli38472_012672 [Pythium oligandrum]|uniref:Glucanase n=1 Tax=Pythium oligandrum TaxID=41045 RepID=A0A8K1CEP7_PYTOL|nr:hypothetical protein Poli38472_012672 [Pythium oligandrum]|eukprot:TMW61481.1 hypothetical protein Poli38472_012672 [Pythium oligandrum]
MRFTAGILSAILAISMVKAEMPICGAWKGASYEAAKTQYPELKDAIDVVQQYGSVPWYTDNQGVADQQKVIDTLKGCDPNTKIPIVVYGIPNKDCEANYSNKGINKSEQDYQAFIVRLTAAFPSQNMIYIVEPDAMGLLADSKCAQDNMYGDRVRYAINELSKNPSAELYLDVGYWTLANDAQRKKIVDAVNAVWTPGSKLKGIALNTSNYQKTEKILELCDKFATESGRSDAKCIVDTSRNHKGPTSANEWCNANNAGIGQPPTMQTGNARAAYYLWVKPPGESDGTCTEQKSGESMIGPDAGHFFKEHFDLLWKNSYFVEKGETKPKPQTTGIGFDMLGQNATTRV